MRRPFIAEERCSAQLDLFVFVQKIYFVSILYLIFLCIRSF
ncbi:putative membrane protein [Pseudomonas paraeruginosa]|uniref:Membrane protein n=1 Tax=Pseudomonas paraeruginosa TaxID=2994495 RepID=A0A2R3IMD6_9PSED|nr:putative membrane protein [Pseudomonas paraeruginosa]AWE92570.1 putative membrane protein [Pseudomonas paraeruginosa]